MDNTEHPERVTAVPAGVTAAHYADLAQQYDRNWEFGNAFKSWMVAEIVEKLDATQAARIVDVGSGTGLYADQLREVLGPRPQILCMDPSQPMLDQIPRNRGLVSIRASASEGLDALVDLKLTPVDCILIKEAVHHFDDIEGDLKSLAGALAEEGRVLVALLPQNVDYPLFGAAIEKFQELQPSPDRIARALRRAGLQVTQSEASFELQIPCVRYEAMVKNRYMSLLSVFTDREINTGIKEMRLSQPPDGVYRFEERFCFVVGYRES